jgi:hypothetical protein
MTASTIPHPPIVSRDQWLAERKKLLAPEKELTKQLDRVNAERRRLPMVKIDRDNAHQTWGLDSCYRSYRYVAALSYESGSLLRKHWKKNRILEELKRTITVFGRPLT